ncbi:MAG: penicillin-binding protein activator LpoB [Chlorobiaceae bacterium]|nr:penicillin-binding protein activator LpoB [Chlorobiaceae bacterium]
MKPDRFSIEKRSSKGSRKLVIGTMLLLSMSGCGSSVQNIDMSNDKTPAVMQLDYRDFEMAASDAVASMLRSGAVNKRDGSRYVLTVGRVINDTMQRIDTDLLVKKIRVELLNSGNVMVTTAYDVTGNPEDANSMKVRELRSSSEFKQETVQKQGQLIAPDMSLSGKIIQRNIRVSGSKQKAEYYFQLTLTDLKSGLAFWEGETVIGKIGSNKSVAW